MPSAFSLVDLPMIQNTEHLIIDIYDKDRQKDTTRNNIINISQSQESTGKWKDPKRKPAVVVPGASKVQSTRMEEEKETKPVVIVYHI